MLSHTTNAIIELAIKTSSVARPADVFVNRLRYRATTANDVTEAEDWLTGLANADFDTRWWAFIPDGYYMSGLNVSLLTTPDAPIELGWDSSNAVYEGTWGTVNINGGFNPAMTAVVTRKTTRPGRRRIGHVYFGPIPENYVNSGFFNPEPTLNASMMPLLDFLGDPLVVAGVTYKPCVCGSPPVDPNANDDVVSQYFAPLVKALESRRPGQGS